jgi:antibiotic biosynthesis monooxygenase (ABM) superfamily enzyme
MATLTTPTPTRFSRPRFALLVLLGAYPVITAILYFVFPLTGGWSIWQRTVLVAPMMSAPWSGASFLPCSSGFAASSTRRSGRPIDHPI